jgi:hypothetical protein
MVSLSNHEGGSAKQLSLIPSTGVQADRISHFCNGGTMQRLSADLFAGAIAGVLVLHIPPVTSASAMALHLVWKQNPCLDCAALVDINSPLDSTTDAKADADAKTNGNYGDVDYADPGYRDDGKPRYPIDTAKHIRAAWSYIHKAHNRSMYTSGQVAQIEARIIAAWKKEIDPDGPPSAE